MRKKTQKECAEALKIHISTFRRLEKDPSQFTIEQAKKLCEFLEVEFDVMFFNWNAVYFFIFNIYNK